MRIVFDDGVCEEVSVTALSSSEVRLEETPIASSTALHFADVVEVKPEEQGVFRFVRLVSRSGLDFASLLVDREVGESSALAAKLAEIHALGVHWEQAFGGILFLHGTQEQIRVAKGILDLR